MKLLIELAEAEGLDSAVRDLLKWHESPERMLSSAGTYVIIGAPPVTEDPRFGWRVTGLEAAGD